MHTELFVWSGGETCAVSKLTPGKEAGQKAGGVQLLMGDKCCRVNRKQLKERKKETFLLLFINSDFGG